MSLDALSGFFRFVASFEPLRQILDGVRAILYFNARGAAGLTRAWVAGGLGLVFWVALDSVATTWYDHKRLHRMPPDLMEYLDSPVLAYREGIRESDGHPGLEPALAPASPSEDPPSGPRSR